MSDLNKAVQMIAGVPVTPATIQRIQAIAHSLGITENDAMFPILVMLDTYHGAFSGAPVAVANAINNASAAASDFMDTAADKSVSRAMASAKHELNAAAVAAFSGLTEEAKQAVINAGKDIAAVDKANAETKLSAAKTSLAQKNLELRQRTIAVAALGSLLTIGIGAAVGFFVASASSASQIAQLDAAAKAADVRAVAAETGSTDAAAAAVNAATKKLAGELATVRASSAWAGTKDGILVSTCQVPGWRVESYTDGTKMCITNEAVKSMISKDTPAIGFWMATKSR